MHKYFLNDEDFLKIYSKVPRLCLDLVVSSPEGILMAMRSIEPHKGKWHLPGGTVYKEEKIAEAALRISKNETGLDCQFVKCLGYMEFPFESRNGVSMHTISIVIELSVLGGEIRPDENAKELKYFKEIPTNIVGEHGEFLKKQNNIA